MKKPSLQYYCGHVGWLTMLMISVFLSNAWSGMAELSGLGIRAQSLAGTGAALSMDSSMSYYNPAGLADLQFHDDLGFNVELGTSFFDLNGYTKHSTNGRHSPRGLDCATGINFGLEFDLGRHVDEYIGGRDFVLGASVLVPTDSLYWWRITFPQDEIYTFYYDDTHRIVAVIGAGFEVFDWLSIGASANLMLELETDSIGQLYISEESLREILSGLGDDVNDDYVIVEGNLGEDQKTKIVCSPILGVQLKPIKNLVLGFTYRGEQYLDDYGINIVHIKVLPEIGAPVSINFAYDHHFAHYYTPVQWAAGISYRFAGGFLIGADVTFMEWSTFLDAFHREPTPHFKDIYVPRIGIEKCVLKGWAIGTARHADLIIRAGYAFWESPIPEQRGDTNYLDNNKHIIALGGELSLDRIAGCWRKPVSIQLMGQYHHLIERTCTKEATRDVLKFGGYAYTAGISLDFAF